jgi:hypothetical protein
VDGSAITVTNRFTKIVEGAVDGVPRVVDADVQVEHLVTLVGDRAFQVRQLRACYADGVHGRFLSDPAGCFNTRQLFSCK